QPVELESSRAKETNQMRMRQVGDIVPARELGLDEGRKRGNDLERHLRRLSPLNLSEKDPAVIRAAEMAAQRERANEAAFRSDEGRKRGNDLERHLRRLSPLNLSEKDPAVIRAAEMAAQRERANEAAF